MKAKLEDIPVQNRGVELESETEEEKAILRQNLPFAPAEILDYVTRFLQRAHTADEKYTVRDGINIARYALKRMDSRAGNVRTLKSEEAIRRSFLMVLGEEALAYAGDRD